jgi:hypothetical protein
VDNPEIQPKNGPRKKTLLNYRIVVKSPTLITGYNPIQTLAEKGDVFGMRVAVFGMVVFVGVIA